MYKAFLKICSPFRRLVDKFFGLDGVYRLSIPMRVYSNFDNHYLVYDKEGNVLMGTKYLRDALRERKDNQYGITVMFDKY